MQSKIPTLLEDSHELSEMEMETYATKDNYDLK